MNTWKTKNKHKIQHEKRTALDHEVRDDAVEPGSFIPEALRALGQRAEVARRLWHDFAKQPDHNAAEFLVALVDVEVDLWGDRLCCKLMGGECTAADQRSISTIIMNLVRDQRAVLRAHLMARQQHGQQERHGGGGQEREFHCGGAVEWCRMSNDDECERLRDVTASIRIRGLRIFSISQ